MADDMDIEAMLEAPYKKEDEGSSSRKEEKESRDKKRRSRSRSRDKERSRKRSKSRDREKGRDRDRGHDRKDRDHDRKDRDHDRKDRDRKDRDRKDHGREKDKHRHDHDRDRERHSERDKHRDKRSSSKDRKRSPSRERKRSYDKDHRIEKDFFKFSGRTKDRFLRKGSISPLRVSEPEMTPEERDARTVFCMQLAARIRPRDLEEFFSSVGKVRDIKIITDNKTRRSKGIAYIEFEDTDCVPLAIGLGGQRLLGVPIIVQASQAEKNRLANATPALAKGISGPMRLYVGSLHFNITEEMLKGIFEPFGKNEKLKIDDIKLMRNHETGRSQGYGFITFHNSDDAKRALEQLNGFELAGRPMKVGHVTERTGEPMGGMLDTDEMDRAGVDLGATGRLQLMAKLAEGTGFQLPAAATNALQMAPGTAAPGASPGISQQQPPQQQQAAPPIATQCFMLANMFDPGSETSMRWDVEIRDDVIEECNKHGGVLHIYVDKASPQGNVYVKCPSIAAAVASVQSLHGRWFAGKVITAAYVPLPSYHQLFPDAQRATQLLMPSTQALGQVSSMGLSAAVPQVFL